jgi:ABC-type sugar transport system ATPase subunit
VYPVADRIVVLSHGEKIGDYFKEETSVEEITRLMVLP